MELIAVVLHCASSSDRFEAAKALLDYGFANYCLVSTLPEAPLEPVPVALGEQESVLPVPETQTPLLLEKDLAAGTERSVQLLEGVTAPVRAGQQLGLLTIRSGGELLSEIPLVAKEDVPRQSFLQILRRILASVCFGRA